jgi:hypothetical protein
MNKKSTKIKLMKKKEKLVDGVVAIIGKLAIERKIWYYRCKICGKSRRTSHKKVNAIIGICKKCRKAEINKNQTRIFD